jgi:uncharacterized protein YndB with AHSA1/START domain
MFTRAFTALACGALLTLSAAPALAEPRAFDRGHVHVIASDQPKRLDFAVTVPASVDQVWDAFTTVPGLTAWLAPIAEVDPRPGGKWEVSFAPGTPPAGGSVIIVQPKSLLAVAAMAPEQFPTVRRERTTAVFLFEAVGANATTVRLAQTGWKQGEEWDRAFDYLANGNAQLLEALYRHFAAGPMVWK